MQEARQADQVIEVHRVSEENQEDLVELDDQVLQDEQAHEELQERGVKVDRQDL